MASVVSDPNGYKRIQFVAEDRSRKSIRLGKFTKAQAEIIATKVAEINNARMAGISPTDEVVRWLNKIDDTLYERLVAVGLVEARGSSSLGGWLDKYIGGRTDLKFEALRKLKQTQIRMIAFFGREIPLRRITAAQASEWRQWLLTGDKNPEITGFGPVSEATARIHAGNAKSFINEAIRRKMISENVFSHLPSGPTPTRNDRYVTPEEAAKIISECPNHTYKLIFGLARYAGLRIRSEGMILRWADINWDKARLTIRSPKTERYRGHEQRVAPIEPRLMTLLHAAFQEAPQDEPRIIPLKWTGSIPEKMTQIIKLAGVDLWADLFQTLRRSCEIEWAQKYPQYAVSMWIGHSIIVSGRHYANAIPDELYQRATGTVQNPAQSPQNIL